MCSALRLENSMGSEKVGQARFGGNYVQRLATEEACFCVQSTKPVAGDLLFAKTDWVWELSHRNAPKTAVMQCAPAADFNFEKVPTSLPTGEWTWKAYSLINHHKRPPTIQRHVLK